MINLIIFLIYLRSRLTLNKNLISNIVLIKIQVSKQIFKNAIQTFLKEKTVIFTTHSLDFIIQADKVIALDGGYVVEQGNPVKLGILLDELHSCTSKRSPLASPSADPSKDSFDFIQLAKQRSIKQTRLKIKKQKDETLESFKSKTQQMCSYQQISLVTQVKMDQKRFHTLKSINNSMQSSQDNEKVSFKTYRNYFGFCKLKCFYPICLFLFMSNEISYIFFTQTLGKFDGAHVDEYYDYIIWLGIYTLAYFVIMLLKRSLLQYLVNHINFELHKKMMIVILRSKIQYFDRTPIGNIINKFSSDLSSLDTDLSKSLTDSLEVICNTLTLITTIVLLNPYFIIVSVLSMAVLGLFFNLSKQVLILTKQFDINLKSTVFTFFNTNIAGILPIKLYNQNTSFRLQFNRILDDSLRTAYTYWFTNRGFGMYIIFVAQLSSVVGIFMAISLNNNSATLGQTITFFISLGFKLQSGIRY